MIIFLQNSIASHESNGIDIIIALILNDINPLGKERMDLVLELKVHSFKIHIIMMLQIYIKYTTVVLTPDVCALFLPSWHIFRF